MRHRWPFPLRSLPRSQRPNSFMMANCLAHYVQQSDVDIADGGAHRAFDAALARQEPWPRITGAIDAEKRAATHGAAVGWWFPTGPRARPCSTTECVLRMRESCSRTKVRQGGPPIPSVNLTSMFPTKPSQMMTSALPEKKSIPSTLPTKFRWTGSEGTSDSSPVPAGCPWPPLRRR